MRPCLEREHQRGHLVVVVQGRWASRDEPLFFPLLGMTVLPSEVPRGCTVLSSDCHTHVVVPLSLPLLCMRGPHRYTCN